MPEIVDREQVRRLVDEGAALVEVLPRRAYRASHLTGAINIPLAELADAAPGRLIPDRAVVVYCVDRQ